MTLNEFERLLQEHDWTYQFSDDHQAYQKGYQQAKTIQNILTNQPEFKAFYEAYRKAVWDRNELPKAEDYE